MFCCGFGVGFTARLKQLPVLALSPLCPVAFCSHRDEHAAAPRGPQFTMWQIKINGSLHYVGGDEEGWAAFRCVSAIHSSSSAFSNMMLGQPSASIYVPDLCRPHTSKTTTLENYGGYILATLIGARAQDPGLLLKTWAHRSGIKSCYQ